MSFERPVTRKMKMQWEAERKARLEAEYAEALEKQRVEQQVRLEKARIEWEALLKTLPEELSRIERVLLDVIIPAWEQKGSAPIDWEQLGEPICSVQWELRFNSYERFEESVPYHYESSDSRRAGTYTERIVREKMPGSYWTSPLDHSGKEWFVSRANSPDDPIPPVQYPYCTIAGEPTLWKPYPHDRALAKAILEKHKENQDYYQTLVDEASAALTGTVYERVKYLLSRQEADKVRNKLKQVWRILNPDKPESLFWNDIIQAL